MTDTPITFSFILPLTLIIIYKQCNHKVKSSAVGFREVNHSEINMSSYLPVFILSFTTCTGSVSAQLQISINTTVGSSAILPCDWRNISSPQSSSESPHVEWRIFSGTVFERSGEELYQSEAYKGRVDVPKDQLMNGNCSLVLNDVRAEDAGVYESYLVVKQTMSSLQSEHVFLQRVDLSVDDPPDNEKEAPRNTGVIHSLSSIIIFILLSLSELFHWQNND
ncbi:butyrophilin-like protein 1 [Hoplias malabaricus]|uniref:butyrophilin-like protein 1 n=1 Tax=Hoplias malabaricus TaxID=27720 RepID=UPI0034636088